MAAPQAKTLAVNNSATGNGYYYNLQRDSSDWYKRATTNADGRLRLMVTSHNAQAGRLSTTMTD